MLRRLQLFPKRYTHSHIILINISLLRYIKLLIIKEVIVIKTAWTQNATLYYFQIFKVTLSHVTVHYSNTMPQSYDAGDTETMSKAILHIWISQHRVQVVNLNMKMQFAPSKAHTFPSCKEHIHFRHLKVKRMASITSAETV